MTESRNDPAEQMLTVLDVLWDELQARTDGGEKPDEDEVVSALWQIHELVFAMADELARSYEMLERMLDDSRQRESVRSILFGPDGERL